MSRFEPSREILSGETADVYFLRTIDILKKEKLNPVATMEFFPGRGGIVCGTPSYALHKYEKNWNKK